MRASRIKGGAAAFAGRLLKAIFVTALFVVFMPFKLGSRLLKGRSHCHSCAQRLKWHVWQWGHACARCYPPSSEDGDLPSVFDTGGSIGRCYIARFEPSDQSQPDAHA